MTEAFDAAFLTRETEHAIQTFRSHPNCMRLEPADIRRLSPQTLTFFEFKGRRDLDIVRKAYRLHPPFGQGLMPKLGLKYRTEFHMGNTAFLFRDPRLASRATAAHRSRARRGGRPMPSGIGRGAMSSGQSPPGTPCSTVRTRSTTASLGRFPKARPSAAPTSTTSRSASTFPAVSVSTAKALTTAARHRFRSDR